MAAIDLASNALPGDIRLEITHRRERDRLDGRQGYDYAFLDYRFVFPNGREIHARSYLDSHANLPTASVDLFVGDEVDPDIGHALACQHWPEFRSALLTLCGLGFKELRSPWVTDPDTIDLEAMDINQSTIDQWSSQSIN